MEQQFIVVTEKAPRLLALEVSAASTFLHEYANYTNRVEDVNGMVPMRRCLEAQDLEELVEATDGIIAILPAGVLPPVAPQNVAANLFAEMAGEEADIEEEGAESDAETVPDGAYVRLSNEHVTAMIVSVLGPEDVVESGELFDLLKMKREDKQFSSLAQATTYLRYWKATEQWCSLHMPKSKYLVRKFVWGVQPKKFAQSLEMQGVKKKSDTSRKPFW
jgi:hypothetical protein